MNTSQVCAHIHIPVYTHTHCEFQYLSLILEQGNWVWESKGRAAEKQPGTHTESVLSSCLLALNLQSVRCGADPSTSGFQETQQCLFLSRTGIIPAKTVTQILWGKPAEIYLLIIIIHWDISDPALSTLMCAFSYLSFSFQPNNQQSLKLLQEWRPVLDYVVL